MKLSTFIALSAASLTAAARPSLRSRLLEARGAAAPGSLPVQRASKGAVDAVEGATIQTSTNWAGASQGPPPSGTTYASVVGTWTIPSISIASEDSVTYGLYSWVGIDGINDSGGLWQSGIWQELTVDGSGTTTFTETIPWYCWYPSPCVYFDGLTTNPGDVVTVEVGVQSSSEGTISFENVSSGQSLSFTVPNNVTSEDLSAINAEWIVEDTAIQGDPLPKFDQVTFSSCSATYSSGATQDASGALVWEVTNEDTGNTDLTASVLDASTVQVVWAGAA
ncbi:MAG: hypothetical protein M1818_006205 [Claussenomyces sp. TS43310]|nr:MAG: hypothetical protein M1818_006205 [Claussenomyces sp. TS43310]